MFKKKEKVGATSQKQSKKGTYFKRGIISLLVVSSIATSAFCFSSAFLSDKETVTNTFITTGDVDLDFSEPSWKVDYGRVFKPGDNNPKDPTVVETKGDAYLRVKMELLDSEGNALTGNSNVSVAQQVEKIKQTLFYDTEYAYTEGTGAVTPNLDLSKKYSSSELTQLTTDGKINPICNDAFTEVKENDSTFYFNYTKNGGLVQEGETVLLFSNVTIPSDWTKEDMAVLDPTGKGYQIKLTAEAVQYDNVDSFDEAFADFVD